MFVLCVEMIHAPTVVMIIVENVVQMGWKNVLIVKNFFVKGVQEINQSVVIVKNLYVKCVLTVVLNVQKLYVKIVQKNARFVTQLCVILKIVVFLVAII